MRLLHGVYFTIFAVVSVCGGNPDAKRLYDDLLSNYNKLVRPVVNVTDALTVKIKLKLSQLIDVNLKNQIMTTNLWVEQTWYDYKLKWEPKEYGGVEMLHVPSDHIWRPDIVLYNNADGNFEVTLATKATLNYTGRVEWRPPAIYKSSCEIDVEYFPFDEQTCVMKFGSWTYDGFQVDLRHIDEMNETNVVEVGVDLSEFYTSVEWDILEVPAVRNEKFYTCCDEPYLDITFNITMRRKTLFYTVNLIIPCMGISFLTILVFYLPSDSGEKVSLSISILLSLTVFFLLLAEIIPPTSLVVPLLGKFVLFTMILDTFSICVTVIVLNIHFRSPQTHTMAPWVRTIFINHLPKLLVMRRPIYQPLHHFSAASQRFMLRSCNSLGDHIPPLPPTIAFDPSVLLDHHLLDSSESLNTCRLHGSPTHLHNHRSGGGGRHHHHHHHSALVRGMDLMDDMPLPYHDHNHHNSPMSPINFNLLSAASTAVPNPAATNATANSTTTGAGGLLDPNSNFHKSLAAANTNDSKAGTGNLLLKTAGATGHLSCCNSLFLNDLQQAAAVTTGATTADLLLGDNGVAVPLNNNLPTNVLPSGMIINTTDTGTTVPAGGGKGDKTGPNRNRWLECPELTKAMDGVTYIADHTRKEEESSRVKEDWKYVAMVLDRLFLWIFTIAVVFGTAGIILQAPTLYDTRVPIDIKMSEIATTTAKPYIAKPIL
ncbi:acetylcholine receptor subunit alpha-like isoform X1 [Anopheles merus]|uniref:acetylcholine receptor subunit alpha-like isoform X1 n=1 Tax=Anopheles merus TaxID=30066 RepID=UPI001BE43844|nr:acetylcholine receptor subunit alpha-like isoform X1 [Anopheles merus]XP_041782342.1 acetylcholine receptor subunit alpha-like isoform X1 [Anopheles merus]XP_041782353.1 acetylcholine receptor subunit alpha-like isoform X1 [Anopheles merus]XP_041782362.1 acetylcholine receptor subunit alpha-like isoform X1 [Anopheles merus]XP_041782373.1 acetylcholine receptor subunit alpha-like isoform X1 [Anopheles merus]XP_041782384.1 acetylcholine receptor subunit alpha-like isoform X1 [Anopheles merus]